MIPCEGVFLAYSSSQYSRFGGSGQRVPIAQRRIDDSSTGSETRRPYSFPIWACSSWATSLMSGMMVFSSHLPSLELRRSFLAKSQRSFLGIRTQRVEPGYWAVVRERLIEWHVETCIKKLLGRTDCERSPGRDDFGHRLGFGYKLPLGHHFTHQTELESLRNVDELSGHQQLHGIGMRD